MVHTVIVSWYVSDYRLFQNNFALFTKDVFNSISDLTISTDASLNITNYNNKTKATLQTDASNIAQLLEQHLVNNQMNVAQSIQQLIDDQLDEVELTLLDQQRK